MAGKTMTIDGYIARLGPEHRGALQKLRRAIQAAAPRAEESFSYGLPAFRLDGRPLVAFGASAKHCAFYPMSPAVIEEISDELKTFDTSKGTIRFQPDRPLPVELVRKIVKARISEVSGSK